MTQLICGVGTMITPSQHDDLDGLSKCAAPRVGELLGSTQSFNGHGSVKASDGQAEELVNGPIQNHDDFVTSLPSCMSELSIATHLQSVDNSLSDPRNEELLHGDLGLAALIDGIKAERILLEGSRTQTVPIKNLRPNPRNPRRKALDDDLDELAGSIRERGILQPIIVRRIFDVANEYEIIAGERRWRAAQRAGLHHVPVILRDVDDVESLELAVIENVQRIDLSPLEQASAYQTLVDQYGYTQDEVARIIGKSRSCVANTLRLLQLSDKVKGMIQSGVLTASHARMLVGLPNAEQVATEIVARRLNVRQVEARARESAGQAGKNAKRGLCPQDSAPLAALQKRLSDLFGLLVAIDHRGQHGVLRIRYTRLVQLENLAQQIEALRKVSSRARDYTPSGLQDGSNFPADPPFA